jgi:hypothetical protein
MLEIQCLCGDVTVQIVGEPMAQFYCHCADCQLVHGAAYVPRSMYEASAVNVVRGKTMEWKLKVTPRTMCQRCGTHLYAEVPGYGVRGINAYLLPEGGFQPLFHLQCQDAVLPIQDELPHYRDLPARFGGSDKQMVW